ncbi:MAG: serine/threonine protein kinase [Candidatus Eremiobacteraeota bacterium]|nr:serine/threonine protein kinase [Candidatus Eremiobacteraeota bacterium]MCW5869531.1 serine/threonine protein kinase [Candidatus Eremiobacteraeota bacterium]
MKRVVLFFLLWTGRVAAQPQSVYFEVDPPNAKIEVVRGASSDTYDANRQVFLRGKGRTLNLHIRAPGYKDALVEVDASLIPAYPAHWPQDGVYRLQPASLGAYLQRTPWWLLPVLLLALALYKLAGSIRLLSRRRMEVKNMTTMVAGVPWDLPPGLWVDAYKVWEKLGEGASGIVYRVETEQGDEFALKLLKPQQIHTPEMLDRFRREMKTLRTLNHPNIPYLADLGEFRGMSYLVMELLGPTTLQDRLSGGPLPAPEAVKVLRQLADALSFCHKQGILHRDIKPENVIWGDGRVRLSDFGLARQAGSQTLTQEGTIMGTPCYMAPEIVQGEGTSAQTDQYSLGCLAYHLVAGAPPFQADNPMVVLMHHIEKNPPPLSNVPQALTEIIFTMLRKRPEHRFRNLEVLIQKLDKLDL